MSVKNCFTVVMGFGEKLRAKRKEVGLSQLKLADRVTDMGVPVTDAYISMIEREYDKNKKGEPTRVNRDLVFAIAKVLNWDSDEALAAADYAPTTTVTRPQTIPELIEALERLGIEAPQLYGGMPADPDGEGFREIVERIWLDVNLVVSRLQKGRKVNYIPIPIAITEEVDSIPNADTLPFVKAK